MFRSFIAALAALVASLPALAQDFPNRTISITVPFAAGGPTDTVARLIAQSMTKSLAQTVIVENVAGAGGTISPSGALEHPHVCVAMYMVVPVPPSGSRPASGPAIPPSLGATLPPLPGVYVYARQEEDGQWTPLYIAQTRDMHQRLEGHEKLQDSLENGATHIHMHYCEAGQASRCTEERDLVNRWQPQFNTVPQN